MGATIRDAPGRVSVVTLRVSEALVEFALQRTLWRHVRLHRYSQTAEFGDRSYLRHLGPPRHRYNEVRGQRAVLGWVLVATAGTQLHDCLDMNVRSALTTALKTLAVVGTTISFSAFSWAVRPPGQAGRNHAICQAKPSQDKVLTGGGELRETEVDVPLSVTHSCV